MLNTALDELIANIYQAATDTRAWPRVLWQTQNVLGAQALRLCGHFKHTQRTAFCFAPSADSAELGLVAPADPQPLAHGCLRPQGEPRWTTWFLHEDEQLRVNLEVLSHSPAPPRHTLDATLADRLMRHLRHAVSISLVHAQAVGTSLAGKDVLQRLHHPLLVLDESRRVLFRNHQAEASLQRNPVLFCHDGLLRCAEDGDDARLLLAIRSLRISSRSYLGKAATQDRIFLCLRGEAGTRVGVYLHAMRGCVPVGSHMPRDLALVLLHDPSTSAQFDALMVAATWQLTHTEACVALGIREGLNVSDIARKRRVSVHTVRSQLQQAMEKMGVTKQTELVRQLGTLPTHAERQRAP